MSGRSKAFSSRREQTTTSATSTTSTNSTQPQSGAPQTPIHLRTSNLPQGTPSESAQRLFKELEQTDSSQFLQTLTNSDIEQNNEQNIENLDPNNSSTTPTRPNTLLLRQTPSKTSKSTRLSDHSSTPNTSTLMKSGSASTNIFNTTASLKSPFFKQPTESHPSSSNSASIDGNIQDQYLSSVTIRPRRASTLLSPGDKSNDKNNDKNNSLESNQVNPSSPTPTPTTTLAQPRSSVKRPQPDQRPPTNTLAQYLHGAQQQQQQVNLFDADGSGDDNYQGKPVKMAKYNNINNNNNTNNNNSGTMSVEKSRPFLTNQQNQPPPPQPLDQQQQQQLYSTASNALVSLNPHSMLQKSSLQTRFSENIAIQSTNKTAQDENMANMVDMKAYQLLQDNYMDLQTNFQNLQKSRDELEREVLSAQEHDRYELIRLLRTSAQSRQIALEESLHARRRTIGRIVLVEDPNPNVAKFSPGQIEMWYNGTEYDEKLRLVETLQVKEQHFITTLKYLKSVQKEEEYNRLSQQQRGTKKPSATTLSPQDEVIVNELLRPFKVDTDMASSVSNRVTTYSSAITNPTLLTALSTIQIMWNLEVKLKDVKEELERATRALEDLQSAKKRLIHDERVFLHDQLSTFGKDDTLFGQSIVLLWLLGKGGFSEVFCGYDLVEKKYRAVKIHRLQSQWALAKRHDYITKVERECDIQMSITHPHVVKLYRIVVVESNILMLVLEQCNGGDLDQLLKQRGKLTEHEAIPILLQVLSALHHLKWDFGPTQTVIHYDLKPANILFHDGVVKVSDFGLSKTPQKGVAQIDLSSPGAGTLDYQPPECFRKDAQISHAVDMWACGVIFYQMLNGKRPFDQTTTSAAVTMSPDRFRNEIVYNLSYKPENAPSTWKKGDLLLLCIDFVNSCLEYDPSQRLSVEHALKHPLFTNPPTAKGASDGLVQLEQFHQDRFAELKSTGNSSLTNHRPDQRSVPSSVVSSATSRFSSTDR
jgi:tousled-like kinase